MKLKQTPFSVEIVLSSDLTSNYTKTEDLPQAIGLENYVQKQEISEVSSLNVISSGLHLGDYQLKSESLKAGDFKLSYVKDDNRIYLSCGTTKCGEVDTTDFIKDGMLDNVQISTDAVSSKKYMVFTFNTDSGKQKINVDISDMAKQYSVSGNGIKLNDSTFSLDFSEISSGIDLSGYAYSKQEIDSKFNGIDTILDSINGEAV